MIEPGIYTNLSSEEYHGDKNSISRSSLMDFKKNPRKYWAKHLAPNRPIKEATPAMEFGTAFHTLILETKLFHDNYFIMPEKVYKKDNPELYEQNKRLEEEAEASHKKILSQADYLQLNRMADSLHSNPRAKALYSAGVFESSYFWRDEHSGLVVKSRPDILQPNMYIDLKTCDNASPDAYQRDMVKGGYHIQAAMVKDAVLALEGRKLDACINICVEKEYPHCIGIYIIDDAAIEAGHMEYKQTLLDLKSAIAHNEWQDYEIQTIGLPGWYK